MMPSDDRFPVPAGRSPLGGPGSRLVFLPDPRVTAAAPLLEERLESAGRQVTAENFPSLMDSLMERMIADAFLDVKASTGLILLRSADGAELTVAYQVRPGAEGGSIKPVCGHSLPAGTGRRGLVLASQQPFCGNDQGDDPLRENSLAALLGCAIQAEIIVPFYFARQFKGLMVALRTAGGRDGRGSGTFAGFGAPVEPQAAGEGFSPRCLEEMGLLSTCLGRLLDYQLVCSALGMTV